MQVAGRRVDEQVTGRPREIVLLRPRRAVASPDETIEQVVRDSDASRVGESVFDWSGVGC